MAFFYHRLCPSDSRRNTITQVWVHQHSILSNTSMEFDHIRLCQSATFDIIIPKGWVLQNYNLR